MFTLVSTAKAFTGHTGLIQRNAVTSWTRLVPRPEIILVGNDPGTSDVCRELSLRHLPEVERNESGAPLLADLIRRAGSAASHELLCYVNSDIILMDDFVQALERVSKECPRFLMVGRRWEIRIDEPIAFNTPDWPRALRGRVTEQGRQAPPPGNSDFFAFPKGLWKDIPPLAIGRGFWDAWLVYEALRLGADVVDASPSVMSVHQDHDQSTYPHGLRRWKGEHSRNGRMAGPGPARFTLLDSTWELVGEGLRRPRGFRPWMRRIEQAALLPERPALPPRLAAAAFRVLRAGRKALRRLLDPSQRLAAAVIARLPEDGVTSVLGLSDASRGEGLEQGAGFRLARSLLGGGFPVILHDPRPEAMTEARRLLGGPVKFASNLGECVADCDVVVMAADDGDTAALKPPSGATLLDFRGRELRRTAP